MAACLRGEDYVSANSMSLEALRCERRMGYLGAPRPDQRLLLNICSCITQDYIFMKASGA